MLAKLNLFKSSFPALQIWQYEFGIIIHFVLHSSTDLYLLNQRDVEKAKEQICLKGHTDSIESIAWNSEVFWIHLIWFDSYSLGKFFGNFMQRQ